MSGAYEDLVCVRSLLREAEHLRVALVVVERDVDDELELQRVQLVLVRVELVAQAALVRLLQDPRLRLREGDVLPDVIGELSERRELCSCRRG